MFLYKHEIYDVVKNSSTRVIPNFIVFNRTHCEIQEDFIEWVATEFIEEVNLNNYELNEQLIEAIINKNTKEEEENVRKQRDKLLEESDKEVLPDREKRLLWYNYRQTLRDLPKQENFPWDIVWPDKPE